MNTSTLAIGAPHQRHSHTPTYDATSSQKGSTPNQHYGVDNTHSFCKIFCHSCKSWSVPSSEHLLLHPPFARVATSVSQTSKPWQKRLWGNHFTLLRDLKFCFCVTTAFYFLPLGSFTSVASCSAAMSSVVGALSSFSL